MYDYVRIKEVRTLNSLAYIMVVLGILLAKGIGFFRDIVFASVFGASVYTDIYFQVFGLVNLIFTGIGVALSTIATLVFTRMFISLILPLVKNKEEFLNVKKQNA